MSLPQDRLVFLLSLPRSGSTLLQRVLTSSDQICSRPESWLLLPLFYSQRRHGGITEYGHETCSVAIKEYLASLANGEEALREGVRRYALHLFGEAMESRHSYFLEKTPRNSFILDELMQTFPDARYIFLWRNPLSIISSMTESFDGGRWNISRHASDLYRGLDALVRCSRAELPAKLVLRYEDLVSDPAAVLVRLTAFLGVTFPPDPLPSAAESVMQGKMGDKTGTFEYATLSTDSLKKWKDVLASPVRKRWVRSYLQWLGPHRCRQMGYELDELLELLDGLGTNARLLPRDLTSQLAATVVTALRLRSWARSGAANDGYPERSQLY